MIVLPQVGHAIQEDSPDKVRIVYPRSFEDYFDVFLAVFDQMPQIFFILMNRIRILKKVSSQLYEAVFYLFFYFTG